MAVNGSVQTDTQNQRSMRWGRGGVTSSGGQPAGEGKPTGRTCYCYRRRISRGGRSAQEFVSLCDTEWPGTEATCDCGLPSGGISREHINWVTFSPLILSSRPVRRQVSGSREVSSGSHAGHLSDVSAASAATPGSSRQSVPPPDPFGTLIPPRAFHS